MNVTKDFLIGGLRVLVLFLLAAITSFIAVNVIMNSVPSLYYLAPIIAAVATYFEAKYLLPFSKYSENKYHMYGRWSVLIVSIYSMGSSAAQNLSFFLSNATQSSDVFAGSLIALLMKVSTVLALIVGYVGARNSKLPPSVPNQ